MGSEPSAASGRRSEVSEWPRSKFQVSAVRQRRNFGHRNRAIRTPVPWTCKAVTGGFYTRTSLKKLYYTHNTVLLTVLYA